MEVPSNKQFSSYISLILILKRHKYVLARTETRRRCGRPEWRKKFLHILTGYYCMFLLIITKSTSFPVKNYRPNLQTCFKVVNLAEELQSCGGGSIRGYRSASGPAHEAEPPGHKAGVVRYRAGDPGRRRRPLPHEHSCQGQRSQGS